MTISATKLERVAAAPDIRALAAVCEGIVAASPHVAIDETALSEMAGGLEASNLVNWSWYLSDPDLPADEAFLELAFNAAQNGGYAYETVAGTVEKWMEKGSGSRALASWIETLRAARMMPGRDITSAVDAHMLLPDHMRAPYAGPRLTICAEFARADVKDILRDILDDAMDGDMLCFSLGHADALGRAFPFGFGDDPFRKKAILALSMIGGYLASRGLRVSLALPIPADYQIPRILTWKNVLRISDEFAEILCGGLLLDPTGDLVTDYRAGALAAVRRLSEHTGIMDCVIDGQLFTTIRKDAAFQAGSLPPMNIRGLWF